MEKGSVVYVLIESVKWESDNFLEIYASREDARKDMQKTYDNYGGNQEKMKAAERTEDSIHWSDITLHVEEWTVK